MIMRILHFASSDGKFGSAACLKELVFLEKKNNLEPIVITPKHNQINDFCDMNSIQNYVVKYEQFMIPKHNVFFIFAIKYIYHILNYVINNHKAEKKILSNIDINTIDTIHTNTSVIDIGAKIGKKYGINHVWHIREFGKEDFNFYSIRINYINFMNISSSKILAISNVVRDCWINKGINPELILTKYDGVFSINDYHNHTNRKVKKIVMSGAISNTKGQIELIKAYQLLDENIKNNIIIDFYGSGSKDYLEYFEEYIKNNKLKNIKYKGYSNNLRELLNEYDAGVICSKSEGFGRVTVEYMFSSLYIIASDTGANLEILDNGNCGRLYKKGYIESLKNELEIFVSSNNVETYRKNAFDFAKQNFDINKNINAIIDCLVQ